MSSTVLLKYLNLKWKFGFYFPVYVPEIIKISQYQFKIGHVAALLKDAFPSARVT
jgi:hypothetical protein